MKIHITIAILVLNVTIAFSQIKPVKYGIETDVIPFHDDNLKEGPLFSLSGFIGGFAEFALTNQFRVNAIVGINNIYAQEYYFDASDLDEYPVIILGAPKERSVYRTTFEAKIEPRLYFWGESKSWGNIYAAIPISYETPYFEKSARKSHRLKVIPSLGYQFNLSKHFSTEVYAGMGWTSMRYKYLSTWNKNDEADYLLGVRVRYSFNSYSDKK